MGYPWGETYLMRIQASERECEQIRNAFYVLRSKYVADSDEYSDPIDLGIKENFSILGEAFELASDTVRDITDPHHFLWDILDELLEPKRNEKNDSLDHGN